MRIHLITTTIASTTTITLSTTIKTRPITTTIVNTTPSRAMAYTITAAIESAMKPSLQQA